MEQRLALARQAASLLHAIAQRVRTPADIHRFYAIPGIFRHLNIPLADSVWSETQSARSLHGALGLSTDADLGDYDPKRFMTHSLLEASSTGQLRSLISELREEFWELDE